MQVLENYITGKWIAGQGSGQQLYNAVALCQVNWQPRFTKNEFSAKGKNA